MEHIEAQPRNIYFTQDVQDLFKLFSWPRMEYYSRGNTGFWDNVESHSFGDIFLNQIRKNILYIITEHFEDKNNNMQEIVDSVLKNYMSSKQDISITFHYKSPYPIAISIIDEFEKGDKIATIERRRSQNNVAFSEADKDTFDWLYGQYCQGLKGRYGEEFNYSLTLSIRNTEDYVEYSVISKDYNSDVRNYMNKDSQNIINKLISMLNNR